ncbi:SDR family oxidoreductase [Pseudonocardia xinjiangensis]|uniref:SDR family oxidoreductase n=1 Tax=Pseudonocardia xinjiangensis TaxID=75289 RepID=A0ABX1RIZ4_9PSEU|nr:SDR family oxidoreductase [Pseudonocardia xinjiangensis]NMH79208.1 SDR family oxidoreductase [Pseudonocardia xinjiangensis]
MIVVTGVTGNLGGLVTKDLLTRVPATDLGAVARNPQKAATLADQGVEVRAGDYEDPESLRTAFAGADVLLFVSSPDITPGTRVRQHGNVIDAARAAGVGRIVYTSAIGAQDGVGFLADHTATEKLLRESGVPHTLLRNTFYMEALVNPALRSAVESGELLAADGGQPVNFATIADLALAASATLTGPEHDGAAYEVRGPLWTVPDLARTLSEVSGRPVTYRAVPADDLGPAAFVHQLIASGLFAQPSDDLEKLLGRPGTGLHDAVAAALA